MRSLSPFAHLHVHAHRIARPHRRALHHLSALDGLYRSHLDRCPSLARSSNSRSSARSSRIERRGVQQVRPPLERSRQRFAPAPARRSPRGARTAAPPALRARRTPPAACTAGSPAARRRTSHAPPTPRHRPRPARAARPRRASPAPAARRPRARSRRSTARRSPDAAAHARRRLRSGRTTTRRAAARSTARHPGARSARRPGSSAQSRAGVPRSRRIWSTAAKNGSGFITIPGPPPNGMSSTTRCRSVVKSRRSCTPTSSTPRPMARPTTPSASGPSPSPEKW